jgi:L-ascorbate metabolism protein UlaG (beta-lactamase superfamily)
MEIQQIRNATMRITYSGRKFLTDPLLSPKHSYDPFAGNSPNPTADLPCPVEEVVHGIEAILVSHVHIDHFDRAAKELLPKGIPLFCQPSDLENLTRMGFQSVRRIDLSCTWEGVTFTRTEGQHGIGTWRERMGNVSGFVLQAENEPTVFWAGDSIWCEAVEQVVIDFEPDIIITHSGGAKFPDSDPIIMDAEQTITACQAAPNAVVVAVHLEALDHCPVTRTDLRSMAEKAGIASQQLLIPADGEILRFEKGGKSSGSEIRQIHLTKK